MVSSILLNSYNAGFIEPFEDSAASGQLKANSINRQRTFWHYLTLGIPALLEALSIFGDGFVSREKSGLPMRVRFKCQNLSLDKAALLSKYHKFDIISKHVLNKAEHRKGLELLNQAIHLSEQAQARGDDTNRQIHDQTIRSLADLLEKLKNPGATRSHFTMQDWKTRDLVNFELAKDYMKLLHNLFTTVWFQESGIQERMQEDFNLDYNEAVLAENLVFSLPYIEGLDGQSIELPIFDKKENKYRLAKYDIKLMRLGDALPCYALESQDPSAHPFLLIRGTLYYTKVSPEGKEYRTGSLESVLTDAIDHKCITRHVINKALVTRPIVRDRGRYMQKESLSDLFYRWRKDQKKPIICGHSLGGTLANALAVDFASDIHRVYGFSGAGVSESLGNKWEVLCIKNPSLASRLINFDYEGDLVPSGGRQLIGNHFAVTALFHGHAGFYNSHVRSRLNRDFQMQRVDIVRENGKLARSFSERIRIIVGKILRFLLSIFSSKYLPDWWKNRHLYKERAHLHRSVITNILRKSLVNKKATL